MLTPKDILGQISGGRVLDVSTGSGNFIHLLPVSETKVIMKLCRAIPDRREY
jgi:hypothetical protein